jgi:UDP-N-acetylglucosamine 2-epimerase (non-hydrolysing)
MKVMTCVGTRPNFIKITRLNECFAKYDNVEHKILHTGQHFDRNMSEVFFEQLQIPKPNYYLNASGRTQIEVIADIMVKFEAVIMEWKPDWVLVPGDVNSSLACALVASRNGIRVAHIESGLRSFDRSMPEEINRILIDDLSDLFFITEQSGWDNLIKEGRSNEKMIFTGNTMIDSLVKFTPQIDDSQILSKLGVEKNNYALLTFHRPGNVDCSFSLKVLLSVVMKIADKTKVVFPVHPRTLKNAEKFGLQYLLNHENILTTDPMGYIDFLCAVKNSALILTDSGGVQEETTFLQVPCLTIRPNTERPVTIEVGTNQLINLDENEILQKVNEILSGNYKTGAIPKFWDGKATERLVEGIIQQS